MTGANEFEPKAALPPEIHEEQLALPEKQPPTIDEQIAQKRLELSDLRKQGGWNAVGSYLGRDIDARSQELSRLIEKKYKLEHPSKLAWLGRLFRRSETAR